MFEEKVRGGFDVFVHDGDKAFGAVRDIRRDGIVVYVENAGNFTVPFGTVSTFIPKK